MRNYRTIFAAPACCAALLIGMVAQSATMRMAPADAERYHSRAAAAVRSIPTRVGSWTAREEPELVPREAIALLKPNIIRCLKFVDSDGSNPRWSDRWAILLVDQCKDARDMSGHYPPNCYVNGGEELVRPAEPRDWTVGPPNDRLTITGTAYEFRQTTATATTRTAVYDFLIVPDRGLLRDMTGFGRTAESYRQRFYGAAQFQLVMSADLPVEDRDEIFRTLVGPCVPAIRQLMTTGPVFRPAEPRAAAGAARETE